MTPEQVAQIREWLTLENGELDRDLLAAVPALCDALEAAWQRIAELEAELERLEEAYDNR